MYYGPDQKIYFDSYAGEVNQGQEATNFVGTTSTFDFRPMFPNAPAPSALGLAGLGWTVFTTVQGTTGYFVAVPTAPGGGFLYYGPDGILYRDNHPGEVNPDEKSANVVGNIETYNFKTLYPYAT